MSLLGKLAGAAVRFATHGAVRPTFSPSSRQRLSITSSFPQIGATAPDSVKTTGYNFWGPTSSTSYYSGGGGAPAQGQGPGTSVATLQKAGPMACTPVWDGHRFRAVRANKSTYITRGGGTSRWPNQLIVHHKGTECVTVRRRNVANAHALRRALSRVRGFVKIYAKAARALGHGRHHSCGCKGRKK